jgi:formamidopyrimidine-DNA glycosylase
MPELPEVETVARGLKATLEGHVVTRLALNRPDLRVPFPPDLVSRVQGKRVVAIGRRAKYILLTLDSGDVMIVHLGMSGRFVIQRGPPTEPEPHDHMVLTADDGTVYVFNDARRFGRVALAEGGRLSEDPLFAGLGPEPLDAAFDGKFLATRLEGKNTPIKAALLDQRVVAGLGNIYVCEALFRARLDPTRLAGTVSGAKAAKLAKAIREVLTEAIAAGGSTLRDFVHHDGELGYFQHSFSVYDREGQACPGCSCAVAITGGIARIVQSGRSTFYCPRKQR